MRAKQVEELLQIYKDQVEFFKNQVEVLREEKAELQKQISNLQEGLMCIRAPEAYKELKQDGLPFESMTQEEKTHMRIYQEFLPNHLKRIEGPMFESPDEMITSLGSVISEGGLKSESLHNNNES